MGLHQATLLDRSNVRPHLLFLPTEQWSVLRVVSDCVGIITRPSLSARAFGHGTAGRQVDGAGSSSCVNPKSASYPPQIAERSFRCAAPVVVLSGEVLLVVGGFRPGVGAPVLSSVSVRPWYRPRGRAFGVRRRSPRGRRLDPPAVAHPREARRAERRRGVGVPTAMELVPLVAPRA